MIAGDYVHVVSDGIAYTGSDGAARLPDLSGRERYRLRVHAAGFQSGELRVEPDSETELRITLARVEVRTVRWPVAPGETPPPPAGSEIEVVFAPGVLSRGDRRRPPGPARMEASTLVLDGVEGHAMFHAIAPDGSMARAFAEASAGEGSEIRFRPPRTIAVTVVDADRLPVQGARVIARNQGNNDLCGWVETGEDGAARLTGLYGGLADVYVLAPDEEGFGHHGGSIDLEQGGGSLTARLPTSVIARMRVRVDGEARLPRTLRVVCDGEVCAFSEDPERSELHVTLKKGDGGAAESVLWVHANDCLPAQATVPLVDGRDRDPIEVHLRRSGSLRVAVVRSPSQPVQVALERRDDTSAAFRPQRGRIMLPNGPGGAFVFGRLEPGVYRAVEQRSKRVSGESERRRR